MSPRGFGRHWVDEHGHLSAPRRNEHHPSSFPPDIEQHNRETLARMRAEKDKDK